MQNVTSTTDTPPPPAESGFSISDNAARRIATLLREENNPAVKFRIAVLGGGCSGFQYHYEFDAKDMGENDKLFSKDGAVVVIDDISLDLLKNSSIDYVETLGSAGFEIKNPNSTAKCGCGNSFSV